MKRHSGSFSVLLAILLTVNVLFGGSFAYAEGEELTTEQTGGSETASEPETVAAVQPDTAAAVETEAGISDDTQADPQPDTQAETETQPETAPQTGGTEVMGDSTETPAEADTAGTEDNTEPGTSSDEETLPESGMTEAAAQGDQETASQEETMQEETGQSDPAQQETGQPETQEEETREHSTKASDKESETDEEELLDAELVLGAALLSADASGTGNPIDITIDLTTLSLSVATFYDNTIASLQFDFSVPNEATAGDYTVLTMPDELILAYNEAFDVYAPDGTTVVAHATIDSSRKSLTMVYTDYVDSHSNVTGHINIYERVDTTVVTEETIIPTQVTINGEVFVIPVPDEYKPTYTPGTAPNLDPNKDNDFYKVGGVTSRTNNILTYTLYVNRSMSSVANARVVDSISTAGITLIDGSITVMEGDYTYNGSGYTFSAENRRDVTSEVTITVSEDKTSFEIDLGDITRGYYITYRVQASYDLVDGERIENRANYYSETSQIGTRHNTVTYQASSGTAVGYNYSLTIKKVNEDGDTLSGAVFTVTRTANGEVIGEYTTGEDGTVTITGLLQDKYTITETDAPEGYELADPVETTANNNTVEITDEKTPDTTTSGEDSNYIDIRKTFTGDITADEIPSDFKITISDGSTTRTLNWTAGQTEKEWRVYVDNAGGTYTVSESGHDSQSLKDKYTITTTGLGSVTIEAAEVTTSSLNRITRQNISTFDMNTNSAFIASLTGSVGNGTVVITYRSLSASERLAMANLIANLPQGDFDTSNIHYFSIETQGNTFSLYGETATYSAADNTITFSRTRMWNMVYSGTVVYNTSSADIEVVNTYTKVETSVSVTKRWEDNDDKAGKRPESVTVELLKNGEKTGDTVELNASNSWSASFTGLQKYENGQEITYSVEEVTVEHYDSAITGNMTEGFVITNTYVPETIDLVVKKSVTGNLGDKSAQFTITITDESGTQLGSFVLRDGESQTLEAVEVGTTIIVQEATDYEVSVSYGAESEGTGFSGTPVSTGSDGYHIVIEEGKDMVLVTNHKEGIVNTGLSLDKRTPALGVMLGLLCGLGLVIGLRRRKKAQL